MAGSPLSRRTILVTLLLLALASHSCQVNGYMHMSEVTADAPCEGSRNDTVRGVDVTINPQDIINDIKDMLAAWNDQIVDRNTVTCKIVDHFREAYPTYNCMVVHSEHLATFEDSVQESITVQTGIFSDTTYDIYVFKSGVFTLLGDGGYINWCFGGIYDQEGSDITFSDPAQ